MTAVVTEAAPTSPGKPMSPQSGARLALGVLLAINLFNYIDRFVLAAVVPEIEKEFFPVPDDWVETWVGALSTAFMVSYMLFAPVFGLLADRMRRWWLIGFGVAFWSLASGASGIATGFVVLLLTRVMVGVGEAAYGPSAPAVISDLYPVERRGSVLAWFYAAIPVGSALGFVLGGQTVGLTHDWRLAFYIVVVPGLILATVCFFLREPARGSADGSKPHQASRADYAVILRTPSYVYATLGGTAMCFVMGGIAFWMPRYVQINRGAGDSQTVNSIFGGILVVAGLVSTLLGGWVGDRLRGRLPGSYFTVSAWGILLSFPLMLLVLVVDFPYAWIFVALSIFWMFFNTGPINTVLANVTHPSVRSSGFALNILVIHLFGDAVSPSVMGFFAGVARKLAANGVLPGLLDRRGGMDFSFALTSLFLVAAGVFWLLGAKHLAQDTALAPTRTAATPTPS